MLIFNENNEAIILDNVQGPSISEYMYVLDLSIMDFTLAPLLIFEEIVCASITLSINGFSFVVPASWNLLIADSETSQLDVICLEDLPGKDLTAFVYGMDATMATPLPIRTIEYHVSYRNISPALNKYQMLCHPISPNLWINIAPSDSYNKFIKDKAIGDII